MFNLFGKKSAAQSYDIVQVSENTWTVHLNGEQSGVLASKGFNDVREITLTRGENCWSLEMTYLTREGEYKGLTSGGVAFRDESVESVIDQFMNS